MSLKACKPPIVEVTVRSKTESNSGESELQTLPIESKNADIFRSKTEKVIRKLIKPKDLKVGMIKLRHKNTGLALTTVNEDDNMLIEKAIKINEIPKDTLII